MNTSTVRLMPLLDPSLLHTALAVFALATTRTTGMMLIVPILGRGIVTGMARNGAIMALSLPVMAHAWATKPANLDIWQLKLFLGLGLKELLLGILLGMPIAATIWGVEAAGTFIDNHRGAEMVSLLNPASGNQVSPLGTLLAQLFATWLFASGGFSALIEALYRSHDVWPLWSLQPAFGPAFVTGVLHLADVIMLLTLLLAGPAIVAMFLSELGLALIARFVPQLQVFFIAMSVKSAVALLLLVLSLTIVLAEADQYVPSRVVIFNLVAKWLS
ncbi:EscT/YscT/HrcT family type III secretion system export apparatus protein [Mesorhizobium sp. M1A.F.Ca.IN.020.06.1.1]|nr:EscT/YscT/HrcT family type III secretion system export apparatus protein [Mesorhizobium sp. M1A.F.Ca.IN.020.32.1.1]RUW29051.1 EscT/YscT/HrcT family type III secretion system export apparatus protein [Mesorhizobium sp. M1A.F.Ca.IN.020.06.1.1]RWF82309.1 MAG: EscT/YscT/HrcT family type III secretion system export apparatus protein [Mesorhizobium sp.]RWG04308.1 MAG: EscT/YscT/HrcT family type III secretion system export apparatus protein [Mesorhizobium sp.]RWG91815.1 MAG: EscT/YscT/HrcT family t